MSGIGADLLEDCSKHVEHVQYCDTECLDQRTTCRTEISGLKSIIGRVRGVDGPTKQLRISADRQRDWKVVKRRGEYREYCDIETRSGHFTPKYVPHPGHFPLPGILVLR